MTVISLIMIGRPRSTMFARSDVEPLTPVWYLQRSNTKAGQRVGEATDRVTSMLVRNWRSLLFPIDLLKIGAGRSQKSG